MKCPLSITVKLTRQEKFIGATTDCLKAECAWWSSDIEACDPTNLSRKFDTLTRLLRSIAKELTLLRPK
jgi:hypothetical protein